MGGSDCELVRDGFLAQPANAWSSLAYVVAGVYVLVRCRRDRTPCSLMVAAAASSLVVVAVGSFAFHGPQPSWAGPVHDGSIAVLLAMWGLLAAHAPLAVAAGVATTAVAAVTLVPFADVAVNGSLGVVLVAAEMRRRPEHPRPVAALALFAVAVAFLALGRTGGPLCAPGSLVQAHAGWHVLSAAAAGVALSRDRRHVHTTTEDSVGASGSR